MSDAGDEARLRDVPEWLGRRYRVDCLVATGGMGHVYRAWDTVLETRVAVKVPRASRPDAALLRRRLRREVRLAQQVSHPNVCRIFDITVDEELDLTLLSMQYVDGETLHELLPAGEPAERERPRIAAEICRGLEAIHEQGLIHRDLKPANVMIDRTGRALILDFGLADEVEARTNPRSGTPTYLAPEQRDGREVSQASDLYALGLVLYQLFTGKYPDPRAATAQLEAILEDAQSLPGELRKSAIEPPLARQLLRCLAEAPDRRPGSVEEVARALPSPPPMPTEVEHLLAQPRPRPSRTLAWCWWLATLVGLALVAFGSRHTQPSRAALAGLAPDELTSRAREIVGELGFDGGSGERRTGFVYSHPATEHGVDGFEAVRFGYRQRPAPLMRWRQSRIFRAYDDPPFVVPGEVGVQLDPHGRLVRLDAPREGRPAGLRRFPTGAADVPAAAVSPPGASAVGTLVYGVGFGGVLLGVLWLARRRLCDQLADRPAAYRLAIFVLVLRTFAGLVAAPHRWGPAELELVLSILSRALLMAALVWVVYVALEPWVRFYSPERAASWVRVVYGRFVDPLVGRDLLAGGLFGLAVLLWARLYALVLPRLGLPAPDPHRLSTLVGMVGQREIDLHVEAMGSLPRAVGVAFYAASHAVLVSILLIGALVLLRRLLVKPWISRTVAFLLLVALLYPKAGHPALDLLAAAGTAGLLFAALFRCGFLSFVTAMVFGWVLSSHPLTLDPSSWALAGATVPLVLALAIATWGLRASLAGADAAAHG